jgi:predicted Rossmann-fold nucleotide-binding protein
MIDKGKDIINIDDEKQSTNHTIGAIIEEEQSQEKRSQEEEESLTSPTFQNQKHIFLEN